VQAVEIPADVVLKGHRDAVLTVAFSHDGKKIVTAGRDGSGWDGVVRIWDAESGKLLKRLYDWNSIYTIHSVAFSPDGKKVAAAGAMNEIRIWDAESEKLLLQFEGHTNSIHSVAFSPDGKSIASASFDKTVRIWDADSGSELKKFELEKYAVSATFSPDGKKLAVLSGGNALILDADSGKEFQKFDECCRVAFSPDGKKIVTVGRDNIARIRDAESGDELQKMEGHARDIEFASFSPDSTKIVTAGGEDNTARIWDVDSGEELQARQGPRVFNYGGMAYGKLEFVGWVECAVFSPDGKRIAMTAADCTVRIYALEQ